MKYLPFWIGLNFRISVVVVWGGGVKEFDSWSSGSGVLFTKYDIECMWLLTYTKLDAGKIHVPYTLHVFHDKANRWPTEHEIMFYVSISYPLTKYFLHNYQSPINQSWPSLSYFEDRVRLSE